MFAGEVDPRSSTQSISSDSSVFTSSAKPLERRVSRCDAGRPAGFCVALSDELRKSFMKLCATEALGDYLNSGSFPLAHLVGGQRTGDIRLLGLRPYLLSLAAFATADPPPAELEAATADVLAGFPSVFAISLWISTLPLKYAPSSMATRWVTISPTAMADLVSSARSLAWILPSSLP